jgi:hypothetical protein
VPVVVKDVAGLVPGELRVELHTAWCYGTVAADAVALPCPLCTLLLLCGCTHQSSGHLQPVGQEGLAPQQKSFRQQWQLRCAATQSSLTCVMSLRTT